MKNYENFEVEDFLSDDSFITWVLIPDDEKNNFWKSYVSTYPDQVEKVSRAKNILLSLKPLPADQPLSEAEFAQLSSNIYNRTIHIKEKPTFKLYQKTWFKVASIVLILISSVFILFKVKNENTNVVQVQNQSVKMISFFNQDEKRKLITLDDGSLVFLAPKSTITYPEKLDVKKREVTLIGEAFFEVKKDKTRPFSVHSGNMVTKVLGTSFTVRAFPGKEKFSVVVNTGLVEVSNLDKNQKIISKVLLTPNQQTNLINKELKLKKDTVETPLMLSPEVSARVFSFSNAPLSEIINKLQEAYGVQINYNEQKFANATVTASLAQLPLDQKIKMICSAIDAEYSFANGQITIK